MNKKKIIVVGDFNMNFSQESNTIAYLINLFASYNLNFIINEPTRIDTYHLSEKTIDNIATNLESNSYTTKVINNCISDHFAQNITCTLIGKSNTKDNNTITRRRFTDDNILELKSQLDMVNWDTVYAKKTPDGKYNEFENLFLSIFNKCFPKCTLKVEMHIETKPGSQQK